MQEYIKKTVKGAEILLAFIVLLGVLVYVFNSIGFFFVADWSHNLVFYELIYEVLLITIGLELARMLITHNYESILELLAFVIARKMLKPDITTMDIALGVLSFVGILVAKRYLFMRHSKNNIDELAKSDV